MSVQTQTSPVGTACDFSLAHYRELLQCVRGRGLELVPFRTFLQQAPTDGRYALLRHDLDVRLQPARELWQVEVELGVHSTWFIRTHAKGYSLDQREFRQWLSQVAASGSEIALHEEASHATAAAAKLVAGISQERSRLEDIIGAPVLGISTHIPKRARIAVTEELARLAGFAYEAGSSKFNPPGITFCSDSNRVWKCLRQGQWQSPVCPCKMEVSSMYLATHPDWWGDLNRPAEEIVQYLLAGN